MDTINRLPEPFSSVELGQLRIYLSYGDKLPARTLREWFFGRPLYKEIIDFAKSDGILDATAHAANYGFVRRGPAQSFDLESSNPLLTVFVELVATRDDLEDFCVRHKSLLVGKTIVYSHLEQWIIRPTNE